MGVWTVLVVALQLLLKVGLDVEAQLLGECHDSANPSGHQFAGKGDERKSFQP